MTELRQQSPYSLTSEEYALMFSLSKLIIPSGNDPSKEPGAKEVGEINYIDSSLADMPAEGQNRFRESMRMLNHISKEKFGKKFPDLETQYQDQLFRTFLMNPQTRERAFELRSLCLEGFYSDYRDPWYEGISGWEYVGFRGKRISDLKKDWSFLRIYREFKEK